MKNEIQVGSFIKFVCRKGIERKGEVEKVDNVHFHYSYSRGRCFLYGDKMITLFIKGVGFRNFYRSEMENLEFVTE